MNKKFVSFLVCLLGYATLSLNCYAEQFKALVFTKTEGFHHTSINAGVRGVQALAEKHFFELDWHVNAGKFNDKNLEQYDVVIFLLTTGNILNETQQAALERFIQSGKGFVGVHSASDTEYDWPWYTKLIGRNFVIHPPKQTAEINVVNHQFPGTERMPKTFLWTDEYYEFGEENIKGLNYILAVDEKTFDPSAHWPSKNLKTEGMGDFHPIAWYHEFDGGRSFYTGLGHLDAVYEDTLFQEHLYGGIYWAATGKGLRAAKKSR